MQHQQYQRRQRQIGLVAAQHEHYTVQGYCSKHTQLTEQQTKREIRPQLAPIGVPDGSGRKEHRRGQHRRVKGHGIGRSKVRVAHGAQTIANEQ
jgi:hypothetical protein